MADKEAGSGWALRPAVDADLDVLVELRATVMRADLIRLGRYDEHRVRQRLRDGFDPRYTSAIVAAGEVIGCLTVRPADDGWWLEHFYLAAHRQGGGIGSAVLRGVLARADAQRLPVRLVVLQGSAARRLYERHGFVFEREDPVDVYLMRPVAAATPA
ncbi:GNAT family N-acetyltransferase [Actinocatenispora sera]|uniref:N-acetyltransferase n=1 Tax=Actinocatenispora sera TaxID=390989 RepID=A0A810L8B8_9ACTN|nr:GNAT family N-acetyltransferase [Actinocatenispora sera]BCJ31543.1 N-acetyltransferase [Actinocatenispora sera]